MWELHEKAKKDNPGKHFVIGMGLLAARCTPGADVKSVACRARYLGILAHAAPEALATWSKDGHYYDCLFRALAVIPADIRTYLQMHATELGQFISHVSRNQRVENVTHVVAAPA